MQGRPHRCTYAHQVHFQTSTNECFCALNVEFFQKWRLFWCTAPNLYSLSAYTHRTNTTLLVSASNHPKSVRIVVV
jgi:hypothetical protein